MPPNSTEPDPFIPTLYLTRHTGALLMWFQNKYAFRGDPEKLKSALVSVTIKNLLFGWWSVVSVFANPIITVNNWLEFNTYKKDYARYIASPQQYLAEARHAEESGVNKRNQRVKLAVMALLVIAAFIALFLIISIIEAGKEPVL